MKSICGSATALSRRIVSTRLLKPVSFARNAAKSCGSPNVYGIREHSEHTYALTHDRLAPGVANPEFHRHSTRYHNTTRSVLASLETVTVSHVEPKTAGDVVAWKLVRFFRWLSDKYFKRNFVQRACMLETIAAVPGLVAGVTHHMRSLREVSPCLWIKPTMDEAENERMHLMTFMHVAAPTKFQRLLILGAQAVVTTAYFPFYMLFPRVAHRFTGYLEEEAVHTYSEMLKDLDKGLIPNVPAPTVAINYWNLPTDATLRDVVLVIRADEADHREVNHHLAHLCVNYKLHKPCDEFHFDLEKQDPNRPQPAA